MVDGKFIPCHLDILTDEMYNLNTEAPRNYLCIPVPVISIRYPVKQAFEYTLCARVCVCVCVCVCEKRAARSTSLSASLLHAARPN